MLPYHRTFPSASFMEPILGSLTDKIVTIDLEITRDKRRLLHMGALFRGESFEWKKETPLGTGLEALSGFCREAGYLMGHNLLDHDLPFLRSVAPGLSILELPVIDTLYLSPLAFPERPYHRLVKEYRLIRSSISDPLADAHLCRHLFMEQMDRFRQEADRNPFLLSFYRSCFMGGELGGWNGTGMSSAFEAMGISQLPEYRSPGEWFLHLSDGCVCRSGTEKAISLMGMERILSPVQAYALSYVNVSGSRTIVPPWVRSRFPEMSPFLRASRETPCGDGSCSYCRRNHDPERQLKRFFGFSSYRKTPSTADGKSLQREVVLKGLSGEPLMAILPTGGGKSFCYQIPALSRYMQRGLLTVVISPLQSLMKDQVDNMERYTGSSFAGAIYGLLTSPERGAVIDQVRMGDIAVLYLSPEQLRSRSVREVLREREIGSWVFDEAHCLSRWGHDFRPDYLYAARFIRELAEEMGTDIPPVACFTATAKEEVIAEITGFFRTELKQTLLLFRGGFERDNLYFDIIRVNAAEKPERTVELVGSCMVEHPGSSIIIYAALRKSTEFIRDYLGRKGIPAEAFHAGLEPHEKRRVIDGFVSGEFSVIAATNAFGMGIDKSNIRLVLHYDIPGSLENYLQEAGRAGRDMMPSRCVLLYDPDDTETQHKLGSFSQISRKEIQYILKALRKRRNRPGRDDELVITVQELLRGEEASGLFQKGDAATDTKVKTALSWLERGGFLERNQNRTQVFEGKPVLKSVEEAEPVISKMNLFPLTARLWRDILMVLFNNSKSGGLSADDIAECLSGGKGYLLDLSKLSKGLTPSQLILSAMHEMAMAGLLDKGMMLSAFIRAKGKGRAEKEFSRISAIEERMLSIFEELQPDAVIGVPYPLDIGRLNQRLMGEGHGSDPVTIRRLLSGLKQDGKGLCASKGSMELIHDGHNRYRMVLLRSFGAVRETAMLRRMVAALILRVLIEKAKREEMGTGQEILVAFGSSELEEAIRSDLFLHAKIRKKLAAIDRALLFLNDHKVITLQQGLAVFRQAMTIRLNPLHRKRQYTASDYQSLETHYGERRFQVHVIAEYASMALQKVARAIELSVDYFSLPKDRFVRKYFHDRRKMLKRATSEASFQKIVEVLKNPVQIGIVESPVHSNMLILAGPGSGKTTLVVHRCAYLLRVERIPADRILIMCFNHNASVSLKKRLSELVGAEAKGVMVATYHGAAMRIAGLSIRDIIEGKEDISGFDFGSLIRDAAALLKGEKNIPGLDSEDMRDHLLYGFTHILVDEYQDIDQDQYDLVSAIAGRSLEEEEGRLSIMAVGDDDQNIYAFRGADVGFIRQFREDYSCKTMYMVDNYRSSGHIIEASSQLISKNKDRMKADHPIRVDFARRNDPKGGTFEAGDPLSKGRVQRIEVRDSLHQILAVHGEMERIRGLAKNSDWSSFAVLSRKNASLHAIRAFLERKGIPVKRCIDESLPLFRLREVQLFLKKLKTMENEIHSTSFLIDLLAKSSRDIVQSGWIGMLRGLMRSYLDENGDLELPVSYCLNWLYDALFEEKRGKTLGSGVFLSTVHGAKGLEFDHVFILDGDWQGGEIGEGDERCEERRLFYVGMTRAKKTLHLMEIKGCLNPYIMDVDGESVIRRSVPVLGEIPGQLMNVRYRFLKLSEIYLNYAGQFSHGHAVHRELEKLGEGDSLRIAENGGGIVLLTGGGIPVARLSARGKKEVSSVIREISGAKVIGMVERLADDSSEIYRHQLKVPSWEIPLVELTMGTCSEYPVLENGSTDSLFRGGSDSGISSGGVQEGKGLFY